MSRGVLWRECGCIRVAGPVCSLWSLHSALWPSGARAHAPGGVACERLTPQTCPKKHTRCDLNTNFGRAHQARRCCAASCKERFLASSSRRTDTSGGSWSTVCNTFTTGHVVMGVFIRLKARTPSGDAETRRHCPRDDIYTWKCGRIGTSASVVVEL